MPVDFFPSLAGGPAHMYRTDHTVCLQNFKRGLYDKSDGFAYLPYRLDAKAEGRNTVHYRDT
ncbi:hypothetical protein PILCRDRAFT_825289 [Piloderma croceum F 1598]|uniref:Uncharacterized protein n=1 Tax=Piloderma croceum (strain F 1598) TaxID=765440 RepID=A0A0C3BJG5_PILCF|nr:hypothetical protein PILCRDRAFT_825289 [Piloderma croceum F 1598]